MPTVRAAASDELDQVGSILAAAFADDPLWSWMSAPSPRTAERAAAWFATEATVQHRGHGDVLVDDDLRGAAVWTPPNRWKSTLGENLALAVPSVRLFRGRTFRALAALSAIEGVHPRAPDHWYLAILGTHPAHQGHGVGGALIAAVTDRCDAEGVAAYLESSKEENVALYARHGFVAGDEVPVKNGPSVWPMWREPKG